MSMDHARRYQAHQEAMEDFWGRRDTQAQFVSEFRLFGRAFRLASNRAEALAAAEFSRPLYSQAPPTGDPAFSIQLLVREPPVDPGPVPEDLDRSIQYTGAGDWLNLHAGGWGNCFVEMAAGWAVAVLAPALARRPDLVSRFILNTVFNNFFTRHGFAMLHTTCLVRDGRALLLMAPHGSGKSTTALQLILAGYAGLSDSQVYLAYREGRLQLTGFPVGRIKLRQDVLAAFPGLVPALAPEIVRAETKYVLDLRRLDSQRVCERAIYPQEIKLCLLSRNGNGATELVPASEEQLWEAILQNSLHYDVPAVWEQNLALVERLVERACAYRLSAGDDLPGLLAAVESLWSTS
jgi:hypothetical protein